jgi:glycosyltransferase involved in cell wall biosynthesis
VIFGDGPERAEVTRLVAELGFEEVVEVPGFVPRQRIDEALDHALCLVLPSRREGYGAVVVEAAARGTPSIVVNGPDNAAVEFIEEGVNGTVAPSSSANDLSAAIVRVHSAGQTMRESTAEWFTRNRDDLSLATSLDSVEAAYAEART